MPLPGKFHGCVDGPEHRLAGNEKMPRAIPIRLVVDLVGRVGKRVQAAQEGTYLHGKKAPMGSQKNAVPIGAAFQDPSTAVAAKHVLPPHRIVDLIQVGRVACSEKFRKLNLSSSSADAPHIPAGDVNFSSLTAGLALQGAPGTQHRLHGHHAQLLGPGPTPVGDARPVKGVFPDWIRGVDIFTCLVYFRFGVSVDPAFVISQHQGIIFTADHVVGH